MRIINNNKRINLNYFFKKLFFTKRNTLLTIFSVQIFIILIAGMNVSRIYKAAKYINSLELVDITTYLKELITSYDFGNKIERMDLKIDLKNISKLDCQRQRKQNCKDNIWATGSLEVNNQIYKVKLRAKGDRNLHRLNFKKMSFKVDIRGEKRFKGMEEFSIQSPIIRNYTLEAMAAKSLKRENIITPRHKYIRLFINGEYVGVRHLEETIGRELIEANQRRYGPLFSLEETIGSVYEKAKFDLADKKNWGDLKLGLPAEALAVLEFSKNDPSIFNKYFAVDLWAKYMAKLDSLEMFHGTVPKSVKFFLNPITGLIEPIFF